MERGLGEDGEGEVTEIQLILCTCSFTLTRGSDTFHCMLRS